MCGDYILSRLKDSHLRVTTMALPWTLLSCMTLTLQLLQPTYGFILSPPDADDVIAETDCGKIRGVKLDQDSIQFRGIPYAEPPVGTLRWRPPVPVGLGRSNCWKGTLGAMAFGNKCFQEDGPDDVTGKMKYTGNEDCLYLNVWTPTLNASARLPVVFYIHGGSLQAGYGNFKIGGSPPSSHLAADSGLVFVSVNYRLHAFGFLALDWLAAGSPHNTSGNYGFMDLIEGLNWVQRNIARFGGDPNQVTVMGHSSGGTAILALLTSDLCQGLFHGAIMMSASPVLNKTAEEAFADNQVFVRNTNCSSVQCLYNLTSEEITASAPWDEYPFWHMADQLGLPTKGLFDGAIAIVDGFVLKEAPFDAWVHGRGVDVPILIGSTAQETDLLPEPLSAVNWTWTSGEYEQYVRQKLGNFSDVIAETALRLYSSRKQTPEYQYTTMTTDLRMTCGTDYLSLVAATSLTSGVYRYVTTHTPSAPFYPIFPDHVTLYAYHGVDIKAFFTDPMDMSDAREVGYQKLIRRELTSFVKHGHPDSSKWLPYPKSTAVLDNETDVTGSYHSTECEFWLKNGFFAYSWIN